MPSTHKYNLPGNAPAPKEPKNKDRVDLIKSQKTEKVAITLNPSDLENMEDLDESVIKKKYEQALVCLTMG